ncbi:photosystem I reaction center subunit PsaK [Glaesserella parasuis]|nr:photosystem I reaction center subunit PsaK [Glaesserella parasuis]
MNLNDNKRFTLRFLGVFLMETLNISGTELRKTIWAVVLGIALLKLTDAVLALLPLFIR